MELINSYSFTSSVQDLHMLSNTFHVAVPTIVDGITMWLEQESSTWGEWLSLF